MAFDIVCAGTSWGGLFALRRIVRDLGEGFRAPLVIVQHRHRDSDSLLTDLLQDCTSLPVGEVEDKQPIEPGRIYIAPPNYHLLMDAGHFALSTDEPVRFSRPSIDVTFSAAADEFGRRAIGVVLTGANADGAEGVRRIADAGGVAIVQDPASAESPMMPRAALRAVPDAECLPLERIAERLQRLVGGGPRAEPAGDPRAAPPRGDSRPSPQSGPAPDPRPPARPDARLEPRPDQRPEHRPEAR